MVSAPFPGPPVARGHVEPAPRRVRGVVGGRTLFDTTAAHYVWLQPYYPQYFVPLADCDPDLLADTGRQRHEELGTVREFGVRVGGDVHPGAARVYGPDAAPGIAGAVHFDWEVVDEWYEEDERIFVHPRSPYVRVDALRSSRLVRIEVAGIMLAESSSPVMVFDTGLPTRYYLDPSRVAFEHLVPSDTRSSCPYKGTTSRYWSATVNGETVTDIAWSYDFPVPQLPAVAGLVAFYDERVDVFLDGERQSRPEVRAPGQR